jgi:hypothetical protein
VSVAWEGKAGLTSQAQSPDCAFGTKAVSSTGKSEFSGCSADSSPLNPARQTAALVFVLYLDHVLYSRTAALAMKPQKREAVGWLVYDCELYVTIVWDRDAEPPTLKGGDPKASGLVLLKTDILELTKLKVHAGPSKENSECYLNSPQPTVKHEYAFRKTERKTQNQRSSNI